MPGPSHTELPKVKKASAFLATHSAFITKHQAEIDAFRATHPKVSASLAAIAVRRQIAEQLLAQSEAAMAKAKVVNRGKKSKQAAE